MHALLRRLALPLTGFAALSLLTLSAGARTVTDDNGASVEVPDKVERVAVTNIFPLAAAVTAYTQSGETVIGMHPASYAAAKNGLLGELWPEVLRADTGFITGNVLNVEALLSLDPDVVLVNAPDKRTLEAVRNAGLPAVAVSATKWDYDVEKTRASWMRILGELFPDAPVKPEIVAAESERLATLVSDRLTNLEEKDRPSVLFLVRLSPTEIVTSGKHFFGQYWANAAGGRNAAEHITLQNANAVITMEDVHALDPDVILLTNFTTAQPEDLLENRTEGRDWQGLRAVEKKAVHKMPLGLYRSFTPSIDSPLTLLWMAKTLHPERFADVDLAAETKRFYKTVFGADLTDAQSNASIDLRRPRASAPRAPADPAKIPWKRVSPPCAAKRGAFVFGWERSPRSFSSSSWAPSVSGATASRPTTP